MYIQIIKAVHVFKICPKVRNGEKELWYVELLVFIFIAAAKLASET